MAYTVKIQFKSGRHVTLGNVDSVFYKDKQDELPIDKVVLSENVSYNFEYTDSRDSIRNFLFNSDNVEYMDIY